MLVTTLMKNAKYEYEVENKPQCTLTDCEYDDLKELAKQWYGYEDTVGTEGLDFTKHWQPRYMRQAFEFIKEFTILLIKYTPMDFNDDYKPFKHSGKLPWRIK